jgi:hypothetical protein
MKIRRLPKRALNCLVAAGLCVLVAGCATESGSGMLLQPGGTIDAAIDGDEPTLEITNEGKGSVMVTMTEAGQVTDREELALGQTIMRSLSGGGSARIENSSQEDATVKVKGRGGTGFSMSGKNPPAEK